MSFTSGEILWAAFIDRNPGLTSKQISAIEKWLVHAPKAWLNDPQALAAEMYEAGTAIGLSLDVITEGMSLALYGEKVIADAGNGGRPLLPEYHEMLTGEAPTQDDVSEIPTESTMDEHALRKLMGTAAYYERGRDGKTPQEKLAAIYQRREEAGTLPPVGRDAEPATVCIEHKPTFTLPPGREAAPGFKTTLPAGSSKEMTR